MPITSGREVDAEVSIPFFDIISNTLIYILEDGSPYLIESSEYYYLEE